ncbi:poly-beta-1,6-N-acetyl-D-glucosamine synthase [Paraburkholderia tagetis]|uniref:Poly-beta-1,6-N-acetyl-D-glucosamine synthase n=1 Tax=Paraburkholderia tagetis TaxID=2913261 RepID=A0A9X1UJ89_9BURK|nr:poly-beta-1,6-N-acetyl-D-glucosamine synthase [Paraburkholderia tagetis]MCG5076162.1 poly-beta-1,6 N-acetyl-D-glucosamine synthase [Paraburkholderia tagetis]
MMHLVINRLQDFIFFYPFFMSYLWMIGGTVHFLALEHGRSRSPSALRMSGMPKVAVIVPCFNEESNARRVFQHLATLKYPNYEIIAVNDGSRDRTGEVLNQLATEIAHLTVIHHSKNEGKAIGLTTAAALTNAPYLMCIDGDSLLGDDAIEWMLEHFISDQNVGAVTGNPRIRTRTSLLGRMQVGEFSSIVGLIKRTQQVYGRIFTVSGVITMFRKSALADVGYWSSDMLTEDIDISWKLQCNDWRVAYEPHALSWILMPETVKGLYKQRLRWAKGGIQVLFRYAGRLLFGPRVMMWPLFIEYALGIAWAYSMAFILLLALLNAFYTLPPDWHVSLLPHWHGMLLVATCVLQIIVGCVIDRRYDEKLLLYVMDTVWYPLAFWLINMITTVVALPVIVFGRRGKRAVWTSPDRGIQHEQHARH